MEYESEDADGDEQRECERLSVRVGDDVRIEEI